MIIEWASSLVSTRTITRCEGSSAKVRRMEHFFTCPYCWQTISMVLDASVPEHTYVEDCEVCCQPI